MTLTHKSVLTLIIVLAVLAADSHLRVVASDYPVKEQEIVRKSFTLSASAARRLVEVDNIWGSITVTGTDAQQVQLVVTTRYRAASQQKLELARKEVTLEISELADGVKFYVDGPFRNPCGCRGCNSRCGDPGYVVHMDFELQVPRNVDLKLCTVNEGQIAVRDVKGTFSVHNVNGGIELERVAGSGEAHTVNGAVKALFTENPREFSSFKSINGDIELRFANNLSADFRVKTFNGGIYSDFRTTSLPPRESEKTTEGRKVVFRADRFSGVRVGNGGAEIKIENLNGDIRILEKP